MRIPRVRELYVDEAEGFILEHALFSPPRTWPPLPPDQTQSARLQSKAKKMDWEGEVRKGHSGDDEDMSHAHAAGDGASDGESNKERCVICLMELKDRTIVGVCGHEFCFECIGVWANQSRRCPLCSADMAPFLLHDLDNAVPTKFYLPPLPSRPVVHMNLPGPSRRVERPEPEFEPAEPDELDLQIERRKEIYQNGLYCKHIGSNPVTRYRPNPTPHEIANSPPLIQRTTAFLRRELRVWSHADVEYLTSHILSLVKAVDIRSDVAIRLLAEFLDPPIATGSTVPPLGIEKGAEHFAHELYCWLRSPYRELRQWDLVAQYDDLNAVVAEPEPLVEAEREASRSLSPERPSRKRSPSRSISRSPSRSPSPSSRSQSSYSYSYSSRSRSSYSRSLSPRRPKPHQFIPSKRAWDQGDFWVDPDILEEEAARRRKIQQQRDDRRAEFEAREVLRDRNGMRVWGAPTSIPQKQRIELLPDVVDQPERNLRSEAEETAIRLSIKGAAVGSTGAPRRLTLAERLTKAKSEQAGPVAPPISAPIPITDHLPVPPLPANLPDNPAEINAEDLLVTSTRPTDTARGSVSGLKETVRARLRLRLKLESERANLRHNVAESKAQELRRKLLEAKVTRQAAETDAVLRKMDRLDWQKEVRRRLMVEKMLQAETEGEKRARELKERLSADKRRKMLRGVLLARKKAGQEESAPVGIEA